MPNSILKIANPLTCTIARRLNRFVVEVMVKNKPYRAYINNTGRLEEFLIPGRQGFCLKNETKGKTDYRLFAIEERKLGALIDTQAQMQAFERALEMGLIPWLEGARVRKRDARLGNSLIDYLLVSNDWQIYLEVKSAVLRDRHYALYPDCPSLRGSRHIKELTRLVRSGGKAIVLFIAALPEVTAFKPNRPTHPALHEALLEGNKAGVKIKAIGMYYNPEDSLVYLYNPDLAVEL